MTKFLAVAALASASLLGACGGRTPEEPQNTEENRAAAPAAPPADYQAPPAPSPAARAPEVSPRRDGSTAARPAPTTGNRTLREESPTPSAGAEAPPARAAAPPPPPPAAPQWREVTVPVGTALPLELMTAVSSETAQIETPVRARLRQALVVGGYTALPAGAIFSGTVVDVVRAGRVQGRSRLAIRFNEVAFDNGREDIRTNPIAFEGDATRGEDATKVGAGAVGGAIIGGIIGGGDGAAKGAAIGGAAGTGVVLATRGREVQLASGADIAATLASPFTVRAPVR